MSSQESSSGDEILFQTSTISALMAGDYDGDLPVEQLKQQGDFGLGTYNALDGEMIVLDGEVYQVRSDGVAVVAGDQTNTPFAAVTTFESDQSFSFEEVMDCATFRSMVDDALPNLDDPFAIKVSGTFPAMHVRAPYIQSTPYPPLTDALAEQALFDFQDVSGTMVGFRLPDYLEGVNSTGYHFHFLTDDLQAGGHVLDCQTGPVEVQIDAIGEIRIDLQEVDVPMGQATESQLTVEQSAEPVVLGAVYSLTGGQAGLDIPSAQGAQLAIDQVNEAGGINGRPVQLVLVDGQTDPAVIQQRTAGIFDDYPSAAAVFGLSDTDLVEAAAPVAAGQGRLFLTSGATSPKLPATEPGFLFLACFGDNVQAAAGAEWAYNALSARTAAVLYIEDSTYTELLQGYFQTRFTELGGEISAVESYRFGGDDGGNLSEVAASLPAADLIYLAAMPDDALPAVQALRQAGFDQPILGGDGLDVPVLWQNPDVSQVYFTTHAYLGPDNTDPQVVSFVEAFQSTYPDSTPDAFAALGYDAANLLIDAAARAGSSDPLAVRDALAATQNFEGVTGSISFQPGQQIPSKSVSILEVSGGSLSLAQALVPESVPAP